LADGLHIPAGMTRQLRQLAVRDVMTRRPVTIDPDAPLATAAATMQERQLRHLPVVDDAGRLVGIVSDRDLQGAVVAPALAEHLSASGRRRLRGLDGTLGELRVRDVMTCGVVTVPPAAPLAQAAALMFEGRFGCLPVVEAGTLIGIVTERDVLRTLAETLPAIRGADPDSYFW
jgi:acetoin utilization protein AcuB